MKSEAKITSQNHSTEALRAMQVLLQQDNDSFFSAVKDLMEARRINVASLLDNEAYRNAEKYEKAEKCFLQVLSDRNDYYDPLLVPKPNKAEALKLVRAAKYMHAYPAGLESQVEEIEQRLPDDTHLRGDDYYKDWLGRKLGFSREECAMKTVEAIDREAEYNIRWAISFINDHTKMNEEIFQDETGKTAFGKFRSEYYKVLHDESNCMTVREYIAKYFEHEKLKARHISERDGKLKSLQEQGRESGFNDVLYEHETAIRQLSMAQWEIRRLLALTMRYRNNERTPDAMLHKIDEKALVNIVTPLMVQERNFPSIPSGADNQFFNCTMTQYKLWYRDGRGGYIIRDSNIAEVDKMSGVSEVDSMRLESAKVRGKRDPGDKEYRMETFDLHHLQLRAIKDPLSRLGKSLRKPDAQVLDYTGMIMVLKDYDQRDKLLEMLMSEFWASYREVLEDVPNAQGNHTKCVLCIPHNFQTLKNKVSETSEALADIRQETTVLRRNKGLNKKLDSLRKALEPYYEIATKMERDLFVEVQFFDLPSYIAAECDIHSPTHHDVYKRRQSLLEINPIVFPVSVYWTEVMKVVYKWEIIKKHGLPPIESARFRAL